MNKFTIIIELEGGIKVTHFFKNQHELDQYVNNRSRDKSITILKGDTK